MQFQASQDDGAVANGELNASQDQVSNVKCYILSRLTFCLQDPPWLGTLVSEMLTLSFLQDQPLEMVDIDGAEHRH